MKSVALFALFLLLSAFTSYLPSATAVFVYDQNGNKVENKGFYYILDANLGGGGIEGDATGNETCPLTVVQSPNELLSGLPILISSPTFVRFISEERMLKLEFAGVPAPCASSPLWTVVKGLPEGRQAVKLAGYQNTVNGWFEIKKLIGQHYKLVFCARDTEACESIGVHVDENGKRVLVLTVDDPLHVVFKKVNTWDASSSGLQLS